MTLAPIIVLTSEVGTVWDEPACGLFQLLPQQPDYCLVPGKA